MGKNDKAKGKKAQAPKVLTEEQMQQMGYSEDQIQMILARQAMSSDDKKKEKEDKATAEAEAAKKARDQKAAEELKEKADLEFKNASGLLILEDDAFRAALDAEHDEDVHQIEKDAKVLHAKARHASVKWRDEQRRLEAAAALAALTEEERAELRAKAERQADEEFLKKQAELDQAEAEAEAKEKRLADKKAKEELRAKKRALMQEEEQRLASLGLAMNDDVNDGGLDAADEALLSQKHHEEHAKKVREKNF